MKFEFQKPVKFEGEEISEINLDLESLTGRDISKVKSQWAMAGKFSPMPGTDLDFCTMLACVAAKQPMEFAEALPANEYMKLAQAVSNFLLQ